MADNINHPRHYTGRNIGYECIGITQYQTFCTGNAIKYLWRFKSKGTPLEDLQKSLWYAHRAAMLDQGVSLADIRCGTILRLLIDHTQGFERAAWQSLAENDWHGYIESLTRMIERIENGKES
nr:MAG TPA: nucelotide kinase [Caudoviricetes sp.]